MPIPRTRKPRFLPGPNNPVGVVWVDINKEHFGLHGTPEPSTIGRTESHGCIRLTNWDATKLGRLVSVGHQSHDSMSVRHRRRSFHAEAIAPWAALSFILLIWWAGAKTLNWAQARSSVSAHVVRRARRSCGAEGAPVDAVPAESGAEAANAAGPTISANTVIAGSDLASLRSRSLTHSGARALTPTISSRAFTTPAAAAATKPSTSSRRAAPTCSPSKTGKSRSCSRATRAG